MTDNLKNILREIYKPRPVDSKKYDFGLLLVIGGSDFYSGSPALSSLAAFRAGVDMVQVIAPKRAADIIASFSPNLVAFPLKGEKLGKEHLATLVTMTESAKAVAKDKAAVVIGGGLGRSEETQETILEYLAKTSLPVVVDADAIHAVAKNLDVISGKSFLFTPHAYEFFVLTGRDISGLGDEKRIKAVKEEAARLKTTILLKGKLDIVSDGKEVAAEKIGNAFLTVGGTGDTLAGICGCLLARGIGPFLAARAAAYINGRAGEIASQKKKEGLTATDLIEAIPEVIQ